MTWYHKDKEIAYDFYGEKAPNCIWETIVDLCKGNYTDAVILLIKDCGEIEYEDIISIIADMHRDPSSASSEDMQSLLDEIIWDKCMFPSDEAMRELRDNIGDDGTYKICGFTFQWKDE